MCVWWGVERDAKCIQCLRPHNEKLSHLESGMIIKNRFVAKILWFYSSYADSNHPSHMMKRNEILCKRNQKWRILYISKCLPMYLWWMSIQFLYLERISPLSLEAGGSWPQTGNVQGSCYQTGRVNKKPFVALQERPSSRKLWLEWVPRQWRRKGWERQPEQWAWEHHLLSGPGGFPPGGEEEAEILREQWSGVDEGLTTGS